jgi:hypothetical protein
MEVAATVLSGLKNGLYSEVKDVCEKVRGRVEYGQIFGFEVMSSMI